VVLDNTCTARLFTPAEVALARTILALPPADAKLLARIAYRKGPWLKSASFFKYRELSEPLTTLSEPLAVSSERGAGSTIEGLHAPPSLHEHSGDEEVGGEEEEEEVHQRKLVV
jgi:hypothetical protein